MVMFGITTIVKGYSIQTYFLCCYVIFIFLDLNNIYLDTRIILIDTFTADKWLKTFFDIAAIYTLSRSTIDNGYFRTTPNLVVPHTDGVGSVIFSVIWMVAISSRIVSGLISTIEHHDVVFWWPPVLVLGVSVIHPILHSMSIIM